jgi:hypothetical protein
MLMGLPHRNISLRHKDKLDRPRLEPRFPDGGWVWYSFSVVLLDVVGRPLGGRGSHSTPVGDYVGEGVRRVVTEPSSVHVYWSQSANACMPDERPFPVPIHIMIDGLEIKLSCEKAAAKSFVRWPSSS